jgi:hypothetical protein
MKPSALLIAMNRYRGVARRLRDIGVHGVPGVDLSVRLVPAFDDIPPLLRSEADLVALDGHGWRDGQNAYYGTGRRFTQFCPDYLRNRDGAGIVSPIVVLAFCEGGATSFRNVLQASIDKPHVAFLGSTDEVGYDDAERIYTPLLASLAELGSKPNPVTAFAKLTTVAAAIGPTWQAELLQRHNPRRLLGPRFPRCHARPSDRPELPCPAALRFAPMETPSNALPTRART